MKIKEKKKKQERSKHPVLNNLYMVSLVWKVSHSRVIMTFVCEMIGYGIWVFETLVFMRYFFGSDELNRTFKEAFMFILFTAIIYFLGSFICDWYYNRHSLRTKQLLIRDLNLLLFDKACKVDISCYENSEFFNSYTKASREIVERADSVVSQTARFVSSFIALIFVIYTMFTINIFVGLASIIPLISNLVFGKIGANIEFDRNMEMIPYDRRLDYVNRAVYLQKFAKEIRLTNIFKVMSQTYDEAYEGKIHIAKKYWGILAFIYATRSIIAFPLLFEGTWMLGAYLVMVKGVITLADFVVLSSAIVSTTWMVVNFSESITKSFDNALYIDNLKRFLVYKEKISEDSSGIPVPKNPQTLSFHNVSFKYEGADDYALKDINLEFKKDMIFSLVGHNGSGKSTLVKLIMRLYDPTEGEILMDGINIKEYDLPSYRNLIASTFQDYQLFSMTVFDNVILENEPSSEKTECVNNALKMSGVYDKINSLSKSDKTVLTREFDDEGENLSGGEGQKVAISRAFAKHSSVLLLDEPSSALDPIAEYEMYNNFTRLCKNKIAVFISHRLSTSAMADYIYLLENGKITEQGDHSYLMQKNGGYANMFKKQAENYLLSEVE